MSPTTNFRHLFLFLTFNAFAPLLFSQEPTNSMNSLRDEVFQTERAFAQSMADRDLEAFASFLDPETVFFSGPKALHGKDAVLDVWKQFFVHEAAPFSWEPDQVEPLESGNLAFSSGLVYSPDGDPVARFNSIWRLDSTGHWKIIFDKGSPLETPPVSAP